MTFAERHANVISKVPELQLPGLYIECPSYQGHSNDIKAFLTKLFDSEITDKELKAFSQKGHSNTMPSCQAVYALTPSVDHFLIAPANLKAFGHIIRHPILLNGKETKGNAPCPTSVCFQGIDYDFQLTLKYDTFFCQACLSADTCVCKCPDCSKASSVDLLALPTLQPTSATSPASPKEVPPVETHQTDNMEIKITDDIPSDAPETAAVQNHVLPKEDIKLLTTPTNTPP
ncbi:hypothetical protein H4219_004083 [Mycoemilia scoparia]|uniref:Uncharacterized protein n=1 Tax=Mycoemilia scoparia TaxID=417184 RepID=A0A9W7ZYI7_9FUNG|nr:hypothetical protein H4219_004083 [Mycoemilia scoparia]